MAFIDDIKRTYSQGSMLLRLILINVGVFVLLHVIVLCGLLFNVQADETVRWIEMPGNLGMLLRRPWTLVTYMFAHFNLLHIAFNMLWLYWLGRIFMEYFSPKQLTGVYLLGGWGGALLFLLAYNLLPHLSATPGFLIGASAAVIAIVVATAVYAPDYKIGLLFLGEVSLKWVAIVTVGIDLLSMEGGNVGSSIAHIGGAIVGALFALSIKRGRDITQPLNSAIDFIVGLFNGRSFKRPDIKFGRNVKVDRGERKDNSQPRGARPADTVSEEELDMILGKIKAAGYDALTDAEKDKLFKASRRRNA